MTEQDIFIVAVELGSSHVAMVAGEHQPDGAVHVKAYEQESSESFIRKGRIFNVDKMTQAVKNMKERIEHKLGRTIGKAYVGIGGMGMHSINNCVVRQFEEVTKVTQEMVDAINDENYSLQIPGRELIDVVPLEYKAGTQSTAEPVGILTSRLEGHYLNIVSGTTTQKQIRETFAQIGISVIELPVAFLALAEAMLPESSRQSGCVFVDMGAQTTSVAIYKSNRLRHVAIIPLGGANITGDIMTAYQIEEDEAEDLKLKYDFAIEPIDEDSKEVFTLRDGRSILLNDLKLLVGARMEEIIQNVTHQIKCADFPMSSLVAGIVLTGGVAKTGGIDEAFKQITKIQTVKVEQKMLLQYRSSGKGSTTFNADGAYNTAIALVNQGTEDCSMGELAKGGNIFETTEPEPELQQPTVEVPVPTAGTPESQPASGGQPEGKKEEEASAPKPGKVVVIGGDGIKPAPEDNGSGGKPEPEPARRKGGRFQKLKEWVANLTKEDEQP